MATASGPEARSEARFELVVIRGAGIGHRLAVRDDVQTVGRAMDAALALTDRRVSRHHLDVRASPRGVAIQVRDGAAKVLCNGVAMTRCEAVPGDEVVVGETVLAVVATEVAHLGEEVGASDRTDVRTLLTGVAADVRGLASVFALGEALTEAHDRDAVAEALRGWGRKHASSIGASLGFGGEPDLDPGDGAGPRARLLDQIVVEHSAAGCIAIVPACLNPPCAVAFEFDIVPEQLSVSVRRARSRRCRGNPARSP